MNLSKNIHLKINETIKNGSFYTPDNITKIAYDYISSFIEKDDNIIDFGCGYGAFISRFTKLKDINLIATDYDKTSYEFVSENFKNVKTIFENSLLNISRDKYNLSENDRLIVIGNPPYNDTTSFHKKGQKGYFDVDIDVKSRDLGMSFMKMYNKLKADYICILHPLAYLIKERNFLLLKDFFINYKPIDATIFSSSLFENIKKTNSKFPVVLITYKRSEMCRYTFDDISKFEFNILNSNNKFILNNYKTIDNWVTKYPTKNKDSKKIKFYTLRDINALSRNKTFIDKEISNSVDIELNDLYKYAWIDYFKNNFKPKNMYLYANLSPLIFDDINDDNIKKILISYVYNNNEILKNFIIKNNLDKDIKNIYNMESFNYNYDILKLKISSLYK